MVFHQDCLSSDNNSLPEEIRELLVEYIPEKEHDAVSTNTFSPTQQKVLDLFKEGKNLLILGSAGCGKSTIIKSIENNIKTPGLIQLCSTTGISAYNIQGMTIHSYLGIKTGEKSKEVLLKNIRVNKILAYRIKQLKVLVIDEISMMSAELFEKIEWVLRNLRKNNKPFGGIQVLLSGDFLQLLPVFKQRSYDKKEMDSRLIVESERFNEIFSIENTINLTTNFRQNIDTTYASMLNNIRYGIFTSENKEELSKRINKKAPEGTLHLVCTNAQANVINSSHYDILKEKEKVYKSIVISNCKNNSIENITLEKIFVEELKSQLKLKNIETLKLKQGTRVMLIKNIDTGIGLINGSIGTVKELSDYEICVLFDNGIEHSVELHDWKLESDEVAVLIKQFPLALAYAITVHKSQSLTLEAAQMDLHNCFSDHMTYTALSRVKSLNGLYLNTFNEKKIKANKIIKDYLHTIEY